MYLSIRTSTIFLKHLKYKFSGLYDLKISTSSDGLWGIFRLSRAFGFQEEHPLAEKNIYVCNLIVSKKIKRKVKKNATLYT